MSEENRPRRRYNATRRRMQAEETRRVIVAAAHRLFVARGYGGTTIEAVALEAGVAVETVYAAFRNKRALLARVVDVAVVGDHEAVPLLQREGPVAVRELRDQREQLRMFARGIAEIMGRAGPMFDVMLGAASSEPEIAALLRDYLAKRHTGMRFFVDALASSSSLSLRLSTDEAIDTVWALTSAEVHRLLTVDRGWSGERYETWLTDTLGRLLLRSE